MKTWDLASYRDRARVLVVIVDDAKDPRLHRQRASLAGSDAGRRERRLELMTIVGADGAAVRSALRVGPGAGFHVILVGLDGGVKLARRTPISTAELFAAIDAMPMRREELRRSR